MHLYRLGELNLVLLNRYFLIRVPINETLLYLFVYYFVCVYRTSNRMARFAFSVVSRLRFELRTGVLYARGVYSLVGE